MRFRRQMVDRRAGYAQIMRGRTVATKDESECRRVDSEEPFVERTVVCGIEDEAGH